MTREDTSLSTRWCVRLREARTLDRGTQQPETVDPSTRDRGSHSALRDRGSQSSETVDHMQHSVSETVVLDLASLPGACCIWCMLKLSKPY